MTDHDETMRCPLSEHVVRPKFLTWEVKIHVRMCNGITEDQDPVMREDGDTGRDMGDGSGLRRHEGETATDQRVQLMTDAWTRATETYRSQVWAELRTGCCTDPRYEAIFDDLCPQSIRIPPGVQAVRVSEMINALWVVTGLREDARREMSREGSTDTGQRSTSQQQSGDRHRAYVTVSPKKAQSMNQEQTASHRLH